MKIINPYLNLNGRCREAMAFYQACFGGEITALQTFGEAGIDVPESFKNHILHSELKADGLWLQASDGRLNSPVTIGDNVTLSLTLSELGEQQRIFDTLAEGGQVVQALHDAFWGSRFGMVTDRYGIHWMLLCHTHPG